MREYRSKKCQLVQNERRAKKSLARLINANFSAGGVILGLEYSQEWYERNTRELEYAGITGESAAEMINKRAEHELRLCIRRVKRACEKRKIPVRYIFVTSEQADGEREQQRIVHNVITDGVLQDIFISKWELGEVHIRNTEEVPRLADILLSQVRRVPDSRKYNPSRNFAKVRL